MPRPYWSGQIQISLVSFGVNFFPATESKSEIRFHQIDRKTGERVRHQKVSGDDAPVEASGIVKGYEYRKGEYIQIEPDEIENLRIPSRKTLAVTQFVDESEIDPEYFEKPYFVTPESASQAEAFAVVRKALQETGKVALGKIAFGGREHVVAISATSDDELGGMMAYLMRYAEELRKPADYFSDIKKVKIDDDQLSLAKELIKRKAAKFAPQDFKDEYEVALRAMVEAKVSHAPLPKDEPAAPAGKVVSLMDALRKSVQSDAVGEKPEKAAAEPAASSAPKRGIVLVKPAAKAAAHKSTSKSKRKSA
ncbi:DNA end-binding protein Ku [Granulicella rosea]|uniref:Non-homologous end joining protein Ku n=1 Tax=Granulicella rosea TaxID=474952 RepID=A0A239HRX6_9BACT|nr:Ku protein [Granulicella rosea]SNS83818.1 DNA end-binding protein Ku [Granulicella rosea]